MMLYVLLNVYFYLRSELTIYVGWFNEQESGEEEMAGHKIAHATLKGPSVVKELVIGLALGLAAGGLWKMHHWNEQRKTRTFYDLLEKDEISVVVAE